MHCETETLSKEHNNALEVRVNVIIVSAMNMDLIHDLEHNSIGAPSDEHNEHDSIHPFQRHCSGYFLFRRSLVRVLIDLFL